MNRTARLHRKVPIAILGLITLSLPGSGIARDQESGNSHIEAIKTCQSEPDPAARLKCFDAVAAEMVQASESGDLRIVDRDEVKKTRRTLFGFSLPDLGIFGKSDENDEDEIKEIETTIAEVSGSHATGYAIRTAEGAVWRIDDVPRRLLEPRAGDKILIKDAALSAYFIRINGQSGVKARRIR